ncbi:unnamed protein product [Ectocarpus sp. 6 AP-2014]
MIGPSTHQDLSTDLGNNNNNNNNNNNSSSKNKKTKKTTDYNNSNVTATSPSTSSNTNTNTNNTAIKGNNGNDNNDNTRESYDSPMAKAPYVVGPFSSPSGTVTAPPSPPSARSMAAPARNDPGGDDVELGELLGGGLHDLDDEGWSPEDADLMAAFLEDDFSGEILFGLDTTSSPTAASAVSDQPGSVPSCPMADFDDHTLELLASSGVISGAPGVAMPLTSVGAGADASDVATGASDVGAALPRTPAMPPAPGTKSAFGLTPPIAADTTSDTNVPYPPSISSTLAAPFTSTTATPSFVPRPITDSVASTAVAANTAAAAAMVAAAVVAGSTTSELITPTPPPAATSALDNSRTLSAVTTGSTTSGLTTPTPPPAPTSALNNPGAFLGRASSVVLTEQSPPSLTAMDDHVNSPDIAYNSNNLTTPPTIFSTPAAPFTVTTATPSFTLSPSTDLVESTAVAAKATVAAAKAAAAAAVAMATSAPSKLSSSAFAVSPVSGTPSTSEGPGPATTAGSTQRQFGLDTTSSPTAASAGSDQPGSVPSCPMEEFDDHTLDLLAVSGVISGAPGVAMPSTSVGAAGDAGDAGDAGNAATGASDVGAALPRTPTTPPAPEPMPAFGLTPPIAADTSSDTNVPYPLAISSTLAAPFPMTTATPTFAPSPDSVASTTVAAKTTVAAAVTTGSTTPGPTTPRTDSMASTTAAARETAAAKAAKAAVAVAVATSAPSKLSTSAFAVSPVRGTPSTSTSDGIDHALAMAIQALKIADRAVDDSRLARSPGTTNDNEKGRLTTVLAEFTKKMSMAAPRTSATEMMDAALAACMEQLLFLEERTFVEEETAFSDDVAVRADLGRAMMALNDEKKKKREAEIRAILGDVRKRRSKKIRSAALSNVRRERDTRPAWDHFSLREMWKAGEIVTL